jgi:hypothetical protein
VTTTGAGWDLLGVLALAAPLLGALVPRLVPMPRAAVAALWGALVAVATWTWMLVAGAGPALGAFDPEPAAIAALAGTALVAAALAGAGRGDRSRPAAVLAAPVATVLGLLVGLVDGPGRSTSPGATAGVATIAVVVAAAGAIGAARRRPPLVPLLALLVPAALLVVLRAGRALPAGDLDGVLGLVGAGSAVVAAALAWVPPRWAATRPAAGTLLVAAAALAPIEAARGGAGLLAAAVVLAVVVPSWWALVALGPGLAVVLAAAADVPVIGDPGAAHPVWAAGLALAAAGVVAGAETDRPAARGAVEVQVATAALVGWLVLGPSRWRWAGVPAEALVPWERAAAVGAAAVAGAAVLGAAGRLAPWPDRKATPPAG